MSQPSRSVVHKLFSTWQSLHTPFLCLICSTPFGSLEWDIQKHIIFIDIYIKASTFKFPILVFKFYSPFFCIFMEMITLILYIFINSIHVHILMGPRFTGKLCLNKLFSRSYMYFNQSWCSYFCQCATNHRNGQLLVFSVSHWWPTRKKNVGKILNDNTVWRKMVKRNARWWSIYRAMFV